METKLIKNFRSEHNVLVRPMTEKELRDNVNKEDQITAKVVIDFDDIVNNDSEWFLDELSERITDSVCALMDISYFVIGRTTTNDVIVKATGTVDFTVV